MRRNLLSATNSTNVFDGIVEESERLEGEAYCDDSALVDGIDYAYIDDLWGELLVFINVVHILER